MVQTGAYEANSIKRLERQLCCDLEAQHGPLLGGIALYRALGMASAAAFRQAASRGQLPVHVFTIPNRRGRFALTRDVAAWLAKLPGGEPA